MEELQNPMEEQVNLAKDLFKAVEYRNGWLRSYPGDALSVFVNSSEENRKIYEDSEKEAIEARTRLDKNVPNKKVLVKHLRTIGENEVADTIAMMFDVK